MAEEGKEDPFGSIIKFSQPTSSQESKLQNCPFARESETFTDYFDSLATSSPEQQLPTPLETVLIVIASPPESQNENNSSSIGKSNYQENEDFVTPPEHHNPSASSSQEDPVRVKPVTPGCDSRVSVSVVAETRVGGDYVESEGSVALGKGRESLGFEETEKIDSCDEFLAGKCGDSGNEVGDIEGIESELKRFRGFDRELDRNVSKKIRGSEENWDSYKVNNDTEIIDLETEEIDEEINFDEGKSIVDLDTEEIDDSEEKTEVRENVQKDSDDTTESGDEAGMTEKCGSDGNVDRGEEEKGVGLDGGDNCLEVNGDLVLEKSEEGERDNSNSEAQRDGEADSGNIIVETCKKFWRGSPGNGVASAVKERVLRGRHVLPSPIEEKDIGGDASIRNTEEVEKSKISVSCNDINRREKEQDVTYNGGDKHLKVNGTLPLAVCEKRIRHKSNNKVQRNGKAVLSSSVTEKIDRFRYESLGNGVDHSPKERVARERRELPPSITGKEKDMGGEENGRFVKAKSGSLKDIVDALEAVFGKVDDGCEEPDFLETAKKRGLTFPEPRWWIDD